MIGPIPMGRRSLLPGALLAGALMLAACEGEDPVILTLDGESVRRSDFERHLATLETRGMGPLSEEARRGLLEAFLERQALAIEARRRGLLAGGPRRRTSPGRSCAS